MGQHKKKMTAPIPSVAAGGEQSFGHGHNGIIPVIAQEINMPSSETPDPSDAELERLSKQLSNPASLKTVTMTELYGMELERKPPVIDRLLNCGTYIIGGTYKVGKSFLVMQMAYHVSKGLPLWDFPVRQGTVLYLALEDTYTRLQERLFTMFHAECTDDLHLAIAAKRVGSGLDEQISGFIQAHPNTALVIIDTLQRVRKAAEQYSYAMDYDFMEQMNILAAKFHICILIVHHTRKEQSEDVFQMISGTNGLMGAADGGMVLSKEHRTDKTATLHTVCRDLPNQQFTLERNMETLAWDFVRAETEQWAQPPDPLLEKVAKVVTPERPKWSGSASLLATLIQADEAPNALSYHLNIRSNRLYEEYGVRYRNTHTSSGSKITLTLEK